MHHSSFAKPWLGWLLALFALTAQLRAGAAPTEVTPALPTNVDTRQAAFAAAAREFGVPEAILLSVAYNLSRWEQHDGRPSTTAGYGLMHLTKLDDDPNDPSLHTLDRAAQLLGLPTGRLTRDPDQNIRGAAALLAQYARETTGGLPVREADWYGAVAKYSGSTESDAALSFADQVYTAINAGAERQTNDGHHLKLAAKSVRPNLATLATLRLRRSKAQGAADCPKEIACRFIPAFYGQSEAGYGNLDATNRSRGGPAIRYIVIHDTESAYDRAVIWFQNPKSGVSAHYVIRSADGEVTQMVDVKQTAWHAGNWFFNTHSIGLEHEGYAIDGAAWYNERLYQTSARLVRYLAARYKIPKDRAHIIGHDEIPGTSRERQERMHWDPGPYWDWGHFMALVGAPIKPAPRWRQAPLSIVTINPPFQQNRQPVTGAPLQPANFLYLHQAPSLSAPLLDDPVLTDSGTQKASDWGNKARVGQRYALAERQGDWAAIWYGGQKAWFFDPKGANTIPGRGVLITPRAGLGSIPVYGTAYPEASAFPAEIPAPELTTIGYALPAGQVYVAVERIRGRYYHAGIYSLDPAADRYVMGKEAFYRIQFNHRYAFVKAADVEVVDR
ncbi:MAG TPA: N-acetylmuramoyl-L-alanine amidase [Symbiobacteriaceae bacterium]|nr:N-acetylmuramoyl-L-alanine amidase [Symbiobacteriaceae bacterium]